MGHKNDLISNPSLDERMSKGGDSNVSTGGYKIKKQSGWYPIRHWQGQLSLKLSAERCN